MGESREAAAVEDGRGVTPCDLGNLWRNRASHMNARARKAGVDGTISQTELHYVVLRDSSACVYCGSQLDYYHAQQPDATSPTVATFDHLEPLVAGGEHTVGNVVCSCARCNGMKGGEQRFRFVREAA